MAHQATDLFIHSSKKSLSNPDDLGPLVAPIAIDEVQGGWAYDSPGTGAGIGAAGREDDDDSSIAEGKGIGSS
jgi:hypothetical protein